MAKPQLRVYFGPDNANATAVAASQAAPSMIGVPLGEVLPLLADAVQSRRTWLKDFEDEEIRISADLYEVLLAYRHYRPTA